MDDEQRKQLRAKYGMDNPPDPNNEIASTVLDARRLVAIMFNWPIGQDLSELFDPKRCPEMHKIATEAHRDLNLAMGCGGDVDCVDGDNNPVDVNEDDTALLVNFVGMPLVTVVRRGECEQFAKVYRSDWLPKMRQGRAEHCRVRLAPVCGGFDAYRRLEYWPWLCGRFLLLFMICPACRDRAVEIAGDGYTLGVIEAHEDLPPDTSAGP